MIRDGLKRVRTELYALLPYLSSSYTSQGQVEGSIVGPANMLFRRKWKIFASDKHRTDD